MVNIPKSGTTETTNDDNTARPFFANPSLASEISGIDEDLIKRFAIILRAINSGYEINILNFGAYCRSTANRLVTLYNWYYMPPSVHKTLIHGTVVVKEALVPIGELSEEAQESKNKDIRRYREGHTRKLSPLKLNEDPFQRLLISSDPYLSSLEDDRKRKREFDEDIRSLIIIEEEDDVEHE